MIRTVQTFNNMYCPAKGENVRANLEQSYMQIIDLYLKKCLKGFKLFPNIQRIDKITLKIPKYTPERSPYK